MPRHKEAKKDAANGETRRRAVSRQGPVDVRMGEPDIGNYVIMLQGMKRTGGSETSQYPEEKKSTEISQVAASEREGAQKSAVF